MFTMAEGDSSSGSSISDNDSMLCGLVYCSSEVSEDSDVSSLSLALPVSIGEIQSCLFEPENSKENSTSGSESSEELEVDDKSGQERLKNAISVYFKSSS